MRVQRVLFDEAVEHRDRLGISSWRYWEYAVSACLLRVRIKRVSGFQVFEGLDRLVKSPPRR